MDISNRIRRYHFLLGVLRAQRAAPFCAGCSGYTGALAAAKEEIERFERENRESLPAAGPDLFRLFTGTRDGIASLRPTDHPQKQKKAGNCRLPETSCYVKSSLALIRKD
ncbi:MAG TPA: hypothetical protein VN604_01570 [Nitrospirota bacterium]|nr:hypothetical protein [Nitrospirota bacterium]